MALPPAQVDSSIVVLEAGVLKVAVTKASPTSPLDDQLWIQRYVQRFASEHSLTVTWLVVPFDGSWRRAGLDEVDLVATNVATFPDRVSEGGTFSAPFLYERRALRIHSKDVGAYSHIDDFGGKRIGVVTGMAAERDVRLRAPAGVNIVAVASFPELYELFGRGEVDSIAEAEAYALDGTVLPTHGPEVVLIDLHDMIEGQREESAFVVRDKSSGLLQALNEFIARTPFPSPLV
jgi:ABC-type amino acid transport substrate-binding protein